MEKIEVAYEGNGPGLGLSRRTTVGLVSQDLQFSYAQSVSKFDRSS